jgi:PAS domain S-box-containing protein
VTAGRRAHRHPHTSAVPAEQAADLREYIKELRALHCGTQILHECHDSLNHLLFRFISLLPPAYRFSDRTAARIVWGDFELTTEGYRPSHWVQRCPFATADGRRGTLDVVVMNHPDGFGSPFLPEERSLIQSMADMLLVRLNQHIVEARLRESEQRFHTLVANLPCTVYRRAPDERWTAHYMSEAAEKLTGWPTNEFTSGRRSLASLVELKDRKRIAERIEQAKLSHRPFEVSYRLRHADGSIRQIRDKGQVMQTLSGSPYLDGTMFDITAPG